MIWFAYGGFTASIVASIVFLTWMLGMPVLPAAGLGVQAGAVMIAAPIVAILLVDQVRKYTAR